MNILTSLISICAVALASVPTFDRKIIEGEVSDIKDFPYQVSVRRHDIHRCGGSIINSNTILSAAHCFNRKDQNKIGVRIGNSDNSRGQYFAVTDVVVHSDYNPNSRDKDMAILKLANHITFSATAQPIQLQPKGLEVPTDSIAWVSGWGRTVAGVPGTPALLRAADVRVTSFEQCSFAYDVGKITIDMLCTHNNKKYSCLKDSGGPVVHNKTLIGVVSWGFGCEIPQYPVVNAKVSSMYDWIVENSN